MILLEALRYVWDVGMPIKRHGNDRLAWNGRSYNAGRIGESDSEIRLLIHDANHYRVAGKRRRLAEYGLGKALHAKGNPERRVTDYQASRDESMASTLDALVLTRLGDDAKEIRSWIRDGLDDVIDLGLVESFRREVRILFQSGVLKRGEMLPEIRETFTLFREAE